MSWELNIKKVDNGYLLSMPREDDDGKIVMNEEVIETMQTNDAADYYETDDEDKITMARLLERVAEHFGFCYQKYEAQNLNIKWNNKGSKID